MAAKKKAPKKSTTKRPSVARAKPRKVEEGKPCCGRKRGHAPDCTRMVAEPEGPEAQVEAAAAAVAEEDNEAPAQPGPYLAALQSIAASLEALAGAASLSVLKALPEGQPAAQEPARKPRKPKEAPEAAPSPAAAQPAGQEPLLSPSSGPVDPSYPCCNARLASGIHKSDCPVAYPKAAPAAPAKVAPPAAPTVEQVRSAFLSYASAKGRDAAVALLERFGAKKVAEVPAEQFPAFLGALKAEA
jgi:hypothetical protein